jgi:hypothetical protein
MKTANQRRKGLSPSKIGLNDASVQSTRYLDPRGLVELFQSGFEVVEDLLGENVGIGKIVGDFEALVSKPENIEAGLVAVDERFAI